MHSQSGGGGEGPMGSLPTPSERADEIEHRQLQELGERMWRTLRWPCNAL